MPILNLNKAKKEDLPSEDVPDELPSLPEEKAEEPADLAPDELAPVEKEQPSLLDELHKAAPQEESAPQQEPAPKQEAKPQDKPEVIDKRLYFSRMLHKLHEGTPVEEIEHELLSKDILDTISDNTSTNQRTQEKSVMEEGIAAELDTLQRLEMSWSLLKKEIDQRKKLLDEVQIQIRDKMDTIKKTFADIRELKKEF